MAGVCIAPAHRIQLLDSYKLPLKSSTEVTTLSLKFNFLTDVPY